MAVGIIIGGAFGTIVASLVKDVIMPPIGLMLGGVDFSDIKLPLRAAAPGSEAVTMNIGAFINNVISFLIVAIAVFVLVKAINEIRKRFETESPSRRPRHAVGGVPQGNPRRPRQEVENRPQAFIVHCSFTGLCNLLRHGRPFPAARIDRGELRTTDRGGRDVPLLHRIHLLHAVRYAVVLRALARRAGRDGYRPRFPQYLDGGRSAFAGGPAAWFDAPVYNKFLREFMGAPYVHDYFWSYPPHILLFIWPFGLLPYFLAFVLWTFVGLATFLFAAASGGVERKHLLFVAVAPAVAINVFIGQNGFFTAALLIGGLSNLDRRPILSGVLFGILSLKPQLGLLLPLVLAMHGRWRTIAAAAVTVIALVAATTLIYGVDIWIAYVNKMLPQQYYLQEHQTGSCFAWCPRSSMAHA